MDRGDVKGGKACGIEGEEMDVDAGAEGGGGTAAAAAADPVDGALGVGATEVMTILEDSPVLYNETLAQRSNKKASNEPFLRPGLVAMRSLARCCSQSPNTHAPTRRQIGTEDRDGRPHPERPTALLEALWGVVVPNSRDQVGLGSMGGASQRTCIDTLASPTFFRRKERDTGEKTSQDIENPRNRVTSISA